MRFPLLALCCALSACPTSSGPQGPEGPAGAAGPTGATGATGPAGPQGPKGDQGDKGDPGQVVVVDGGVVTGPPGLPGVSVQVTAAGSACDAGGIRVTAPDGGVSYVCNGLTGAQGLPGPQGATGAQGPQGIAGAPGPQGAQGATGATGPQGPQGPPGPSGGSGGGSGTSSGSGEIVASFAGFTTASVAGNVGSREAMHGLCAAQYPSSHLCHVAEYELTAQTVSPPTAGAWVDASSGPGASSAGSSFDVAGATPENGRYVTSSSNWNCLNWTSTTNVYGGTLQPAGLSTQTCATSRVLACCNTPFREVFRGVTSATTTGAAGGRAAMHALCAAQYAGSHLCHAAEYVRSHPTSLFAGAWLDASSVNSGFDVSSALPNAGRYLTSSSNWNCLNWTSTANVYGGLTDATGITTQPCTVARPVACCSH